jgi:hypothetical protein
MSTEEKSTVVEDLPLDDTLMDDTLAEGSENENEGNDTFVLGEDSNEVTKDLPFKADPDLYDGICAAIVEQVGIDETITDAVNEKGEESTYEYVKMPVLNLAITFRQHPNTLENGERRIYKYRTSIPVFYNNRGEEIEARIVKSIITNQFNSVRHILNVFGVEDKTPLKFGGSKEQRVKKWNDWIKLCYSKLEPLFGTIIENEFFLKLVADYSTRKRLVIPQFIGTGFLERIEKEDSTPTLELGSNESIILGGVESISNKRYQSDSGIDEDILTKLGI